MLETILKRLHKLGVLDNVIIIGSWAAFLYKNYFAKDYGFIPKTTDLDILVPIPYRSNKKIDLPEELKDLNYIVQFSGQKGYIKLGHPELSIEFLVPEFGKGHDRPYPLDRLGINAQPLRYVILLLRDVIKIDYKGIKINTPHPAVFILQKLLVLHKRAKEEKKLKDIEIIKTVSNWINQSKNDKRRFKDIFRHLPLSWKKNIIKELRNLKLEETLDYLLED